MPEPFVRVEHDVPWTNKHLNISGDVRSFYDVWNLWADQTSDRVPWRPGLAGLQRAVRDASAVNASVRAVGGGWSLSNAAYAPDFMINTRPLNSSDIGIQPQNLVDDAAAVAHQLVFAQCSNQVVAEA